MRTPKRPPQTANGKVLPAPAGAADLEAYRRARTLAGNALSSYDYVANIDRFRHRGSGDLLKESGLLNLLGHTIPGRMPVATALYSEAMGILQFAGLTFAPGEPLHVVTKGQLELNTWTPTPIVPVAGDATPFLNFIDFLFDGDGIATSFFLDTIAALVQRPGIKLNYMTVIIGAQGVGKSMAVEMAAELVGRQNTAFPTMDALTSPFNGWALTAYLGVFHELARMGRAAATRLKHWITSDTLMINAKNVPEFSIPNRMNLLACSNHDDVALLDEDDRRMFTWISQAEKQPADYYADLHGWYFDGPGKAIVLHHLLHRDLSGFNPKAAPPRTAGRERLIANSRSESESFLSEALSSYAPPFVTDLCVALEVLQFMRVHQIHCTYPEVQRFLRQIDALSLGQRRVNGARPNLWAVRNQARWASANHDDIVAGYVSAFNQYAAQLEQAGREAGTTPMPIRRNLRST